MRMSKFHLTVALDLFYNAIVIYAIKEGPDSSAFFSTFFVVSLVLLVGSIVGINLYGAVLNENNASYDPSAARSLPSPREPFIVAWYYLTEVPTLIFCFMTESVILLVVFMTMMIFHTMVLKRAWEIQGELDDDGR